MLFFWYLPLDHPNSTGAQFMAADEMTFLLISEPVCASRDK
jgi:hypothetical protein